MRTNRTWNKWKTKISGQNHPRWIIYQPNDHLAITSMISIMRREGWSMRSNTSTPLTKCLIWNRYENISRLIDDLERTFESQGCDQKFPHSPLTLYDLHLGTSGSPTACCCRDRRVFSALIVSIAWTEPTSFRYGCLPLLLTVLRPPTSLLSLVMFLASRWKPSGLRLSHKVDGRKWTWSSMMVCVSSWIAMHLYWWTSDPW